MLIAFSSMIAVTAILTINLVASAVITTKTDSLTVPVKNYLGVTIGYTTTFVKWSYTSSKYLCDPKASDITYGAYSPLLSFSNESNVWTIYNKNSYMGRGSTDQTLKIHVGIPTPWGTIGTTHKVVTTADTVLK